jgi:hypothetical protein
LNETFVGYVGVGIAFGANEVEAGCVSNCHCFDVCSGQDLNANWESVVSASGQIIPTVHFALHLACDCGHGRDDLWSNFATHVGHVVHVLDC